MSSQINGLHAHSEHLTDEDDSLLPTMELGLRQYGGASLHLVELAAMVDRGLRQIVRLQTDESRRRKGDARKLLRMICEEADVTGTVLCLQPNPFMDAPMDATALAAFYHRFGFECKQTDPVNLMIRAPRLVKYGRTH